MGGSGPRRRPGRSLAALLAAAALCAGCGQEDPDDTDDPMQTPQSYYPLVDGAQWVYRHDDWDEVVTASATIHEGEPAFLVSDSPNPGDDLRSDAIIATRDGRAVRLTKDEFLVGAGDAEVLTASVTYGVGFTRFNEAWVTQPVSWTERPEYERIETRPGSAPRPAELRRHTYTIMSKSESVRTNAGTFDCLVVQRTKDWEAEEDGLDPEDAETKTYWFAAGVGKVQERNDESGSLEVLTSYMIPGGS